MTWSRRNKLQAPRNLKPWHRQLCLAISVASLATGLAGDARAEESRNLISDTIYTHSQRLVDVAGGRKMNLYCSGSGSPTVVLDSGLSDPDIVWGFVQPKLSNETRVCSYDRAGIGYSDPSKRPSSSENVVGDLRNLLQKAAVAPPYIIVGHSLGGLYVQLYALRHPSEVVGMVLIDPADDDPEAFSGAVNGLDAKAAEKLAQFRICAAQSLNGFVPGTELFKKCIDTPEDEPNAHFSPAINAALMAVQERPAFQAAQLSEFESVLGVSTEQVRAARVRVGGLPYGDMPLIVLTSSAEAEADSTRRKKLALFSTRGVHRVIAQSGHYIQLDRPQAVIQAIEEVLASARKTRWSRFERGGQQPSNAN